MIIEKEKKKGSGLVMVFYGVGFRSLANLCATDAQDFRRVDTRREREKYRNI